MSCRVVPCVVRQVGGSVGLRHTVVVVVCADAPKRFSATSCLVLLGWLASFSAWRGMGGVCGGGREPSHFRPRVTSNWSGPVGRGSVDPSIPAVGQGGLSLLLGLPPPLEKIKRQGGRNAIITSKKTVSSTWSWPIYSSMDAWVVTVEKRPRFSSWYDALHCSFAVA